MPSKSTILRFILGMFVGVAAAAPVGAAAPVESIELRVCNDTCRTAFLQCLMDGGFEEEGPFQLCRASYQACRDECTRKASPPDDTPPDEPSPQPDAPHHVGG